MRLAVLLAIGLAGCGGAGGGADPIDEPLPELAKTEIARDDEGRPMVIVVDGTLQELPGHLNLLPAGPSTLFVRNAVEGAGVEVEGLDLAQRSVALWIRGRGSQRHLRPEFTIGPVNAGVQEDWNVDLVPGDYVLSVTAGGVGEAIILVR